MTAPDLDTALHAERAHHEACRAAFAAMVEGADLQVATGEDVSASGADAEVLGYRLRSHAKALHELPDGPLFFGRLDFAQGTGGAHEGLAHHIGRLRVSEHPAAPPLVVDWRAPVSRAFYQASVRDPQGVAVRRRFGWAPGSRGDSADLTGLEDERLDGGGASTGAGEGVRDDTGTSSDRAAVRGPDGGIVAREIERPRVGPMRDIAATIQPEQDDLVRGDLAASVCVQGAPGTGKTAVGLHRAAYLLYTHPRRIRRGGLLILGPHRAFLSYIAEVLPSLGETGVRQSTLQDEIAAGHRVTGADPERTAAVKHDPRMAEVLRRAVYGRVAADRAEDLHLPEGSGHWRIAGRVLAEIVATVLAEEPPYDTGRERVRARIVRRIQEQVERRSGPSPASWTRRIERAAPVSACVETVWPRARPAEVLARLLTDPQELARAADGLLDPDEQRALHWPRPPRTPKSARWSAADVVLLDEIAGLLDHPRGYGHVVVDEAQDLSPMECRAVARRVRFGSLTVLGDLAQGTTDWAASSWRVQLTHLGKPDATIVPLTTGFRVPAAVLALADRLLDRLDADVPRAHSLRRDGELRVRRADGDLPSAVAAAVRDALTHEGSVGVIAADSQADAVREALTASGVPAAGPQDPPARVTVVPATLVKGLEYDHVVAVEPAAVAESERRGLNRLYVVLTRAVSRLDVVHERTLPWEAEG
ncbi:AAA family ATPase [Streptomyces sp. ID05-04B]|uniref:HelD family protein n=1 Tax=unclassified Streptomyces TaxID=2593676 RepID=UPI000D1AED10|nr:MULTISPECIES: AAA family ATPase [unclassified Streptomyces]AVV41933.1 AAA family ATPase [Streptomyces sp. P3]MDX5565456.1 AAA family ATPase [Streptomyces sp. ID05-04B]